MIVILIGLMLGTKIFLGQPNMHEISRLELSTIMVEWTLYRVVFFFFAVKILVINFVFLFFKECISNRITHYRL